MNAIGCAVPECPEVFLTDEQVAPGARFICTNHTRETQCDNAPRRATYNAERDNADSNIRFQDNQFDSQLGGSSPFLDMDVSLEDDVADAVDTEYLEEGD